MRYYREVSTKNSRDKTFQDSVVNTNSFNHKLSSSDVEYFFYF